MSWADKPFINYFSTLLFYYQKKGVMGAAAPTRREELLKQLKAVEDAIARKKSKVAP